MLKSLIACACVVLLPLAASALTMEMVTVGDPGNAPDPLNTNAVPGIGSVDYTYQIGKFEVRNDQYAEFLNSVAATDTYGLYEATMGSDSRGGIIQSGSPGSYTYSVKTDMCDKPVNYVSFYDAVRFVNWLDNGQPTGAQDSSTTETGSYTLFTDGFNTTNVSVRVANATWVIPDEDEWYKAAYYDPTPGAGGGDNFWLYSTQSDSPPTEGLTDAMGSITNDGPNVANYNRGAQWNDWNGNLTTVGSAGPSSDSHYGTLDQGGNVTEWNDRMVLRGGGWGDVDEIFLRSSFRVPMDDPLNKGIDLGFRVALIPEPSAYLALSIGVLGTSVWQIRRRGRKQNRGSGIV